MRPKVIVVVVVVVVVVVAVAVVVVIIISSGAADRGEAGARHHPGPRANILYYIISYHITLYYAMLYNIIHCILLSG